MTTLSYCESISAVIAAFPDSRTDTQDTYFFLRRENRVITVQLTGEAPLSESALKELLSLFDADFSFLDK